MTDNPVINEITSEHMEGFVPEEEGRLLIYIDEDSSGGDYSGDNHKNAWAYEINNLRQVTVNGPEGRVSAPGHFNTSYAVNAEGRTIWELRLRVYGNDYDFTEGAINTPVILSTGKTLGFSIGFNDIDGPEDQSVVIGNVDSAGHRDGSANNNADAFGSLILSDQNVYQTKQTTQVPTIDGTPESLWDNADWQAIDTPWSGESSENDFSGQYKLLWDHDNLYVLVESSDDEFIVDKDHLKLFVDADRSGGNHSGENFTNAWAYSVKADGEVSDEDSAGNSSTELGSHFSVVSKQEGDKRIWEMAFKVYGEGYAVDAMNQEVDLVDGDALGFSLAYVDEDSGSTSVIGSVDTPEHRALEGDSSADGFGALIFQPAPFSLPDTVAFKEKDGMLVFEAENFSRQTNNHHIQTYWYLIEANKPKPEIKCVTNVVCNAFTVPMCNEYANCDNDNTDPAEASGNAYLEALPDRRRNDEEPGTGGLGVTNDKSVSPLLLYDVEFTQTGRYYAWAHAHGKGPAANGLHLGINNEWPRNNLIDASPMRWQFGGGWRWSQKRRGQMQHSGVKPADGINERDANMWLDIAEPGKYTIYIGMREDGFEIDKFVFTTDPDFVPNGDGPAETR